jgi:hypothetical protein
VVAATLHGADEGDTLDETLSQAGIGSGEGNQIEAEQAARAEPEGEPAGSRRVDSRSKLSQRRSAGADEGLRSAYLYSREKQKGRRHWQGEGVQQQVVSAESRASAG